MGTAPSRRRSSSRKSQALTDFNIGLHRELIESRSKIAQLQAKLNLYENNQCGMENCIAPLVDDDDDKFNSINELTIFIKAVLDHQKDIIDFQVKNIENE